MTNVDQEDASTISVEKDDVGQEDEVEIDDHSELEDYFSAAYDFDRGERIEQVPFYESGTFPWKSDIESAKEFFSTEILYRYDILELEERSGLSGTYKIEVDGDKGGSWTLCLGEDLDVLNGKDRAVSSDVTLRLQQKDFLSLINGESNPQLSFLANKIKVHGDFEKAFAILSLLCPSSD